MNFDEFRKWLREKNKYTDASIKDIISRLRRANNILIFRNEDIYIFRLEQCEDLQKASVSVKSQMRRAIRLYFQYLEEMENTQR